MHNAIEFRDCEKRVAPKIRKSGMGLVFGFDLYHSILFNTQSAIEQRLEW